jgi:hypothetical protein
MTSLKSSGKIAVEFYAIPAPFQIFPLKIVRSPAFRRNRQLQTHFAAPNAAAKKRDYEQTHFAAPGSAA